MDDLHYQLYRDRKIEQLNSTVPEVAILSGYVTAQRRYLDLVRLLNDYNLPRKLHDEVGFLGKALGFPYDG